MVLHDYGNHDQFGRGRTLLPGALTLAAAFTAGVMAGYCSKRGSDLKAVSSITAVKGDEEDDH